MMKFKVFFDDEICDSILNQGRIPSWLEMAMFYAPSLNDDASKIPFTQPLVNALNTLDGRFRHYFMHWATTEGMQHALIARRKLTDIANEKLAEAGSDLQVSQEMIFSPEAHRQHPELAKLYQEVLKPIWDGQVPEAGPEFPGEPVNLPIHCGSDGVVYLGDINKELGQPFHFGGPNGYIEHIETAHWKQDKNPRNQYGKHGADLSLPHGSNGLKFDKNGRFTYQFGSHSTKGGFTPPKSSENWKNILNRAGYMSSRDIESAREGDPLHKSRFIPEKAKGYAGNFGFDPNRESAEQQLAPEDYEEFYKAAQEQLSDPEMFEKMKNSLFPDPNVRSGVTPDMILQMFFPPEKASEGIIMPRIKVNLGGGRYTRVAITGLLQGHEGLKQRMNQMRYLRQHNAVMPTNNNIRKQVYDLDDLFAAPEYGGQGWTPTDLEPGETINSLNPGRKTLKLTLPGTMKQMNLERDEPNGPWFQLVHDRKPHVPMPTTSQFLLPTGHYRINTTSGGGTEVDADKRQAVLDDFFNNPEAYGDTIINGVPLSVARAGKPKAGDRSGDADATGDSVAVLADLADNIGFKWGDAQSGIKNNLATILSLPPDNPRSSGGPGAGLTDPNEIKHVIDDFKAIVYQRGEEPQSHGMDQPPVKIEGGNVTFSEPVMRAFLNNGFHWRLRKAQSAVRTANREAISQKYRDGLSIDKQIAGKEGSTTDMAASLSDASKVRGLEARAAADALAAQGKLSGVGSSAKGLSHATATGPQYTHDIAQREAANTVVMKERLAKGTELTKDYLTTYANVAGFLDDIFQDMHGQNHSGGAGGASVPAKLKAVQTHLVGKSPQAALATIDATADWAIRYRKQLVQEPESPVRDQSISDLKYVQRFFPIEDALSRTLKFEPILNHLLHQHLPGVEIAKPTVGVPQPEPKPNPLAAPASGGKPSALSLLKATAPAAATPAPEAPAPGVKPSVFSLLKATAPAAATPAPKAPAPEPPAAQAPEPQPKVPQGWTPQNGVGGLLRPETPPVQTPTGTIPMPPAPPVYTQLLKRAMGQGPLASKFKKNESFTDYVNSRRLQESGAVYDGTKAKDGCGWNWEGAAGQPGGTSYTGEVDTVKTDPDGTKGLKGKSWKKRNRTTS